MQDARLVIIKVGAQLCGRDGSGLQVHAPATLVRYRNCTEHLKHLPIIVQPHCGFIPPVRPRLVHLGQEDVCPEPLVLEGIMGSPTLIEIPRYVVQHVFGVSNDSAAIEVLLYRAVRLKAWGVREIRRCFVVRECVVVRAEQDVNRQLVEVLHHIPLAGEEQHVVRIHDDYHIVRRDHFEPPTLMIYRDEAIMK
eukprot:CAMPEP_0206149590 /NCGR_PEP_ID=MMETSP1473-20131121/37862_1 /ASSEMBLY_ACC=CAM_ASM_001109 /TAXON_ID=1461547 /ORGANISM="Stichococcus sp, Strain RCC1054" /LENGTH=193 /DNA_ID=CAMNT_0053547067 /DNA_START=1002 /DNA_END=1583 /DNA_ORIENTATION=+